VALGWAVVSEPSKVADTIVAVEHGARAADPDG